MRSAVILGIVAEYDPFHLGHAYHLSEARRLAQPDAVYAVISPCLKQRGELSLLSPHDRAACAVNAGADAVFLMPALWTVRDAEHYALGAVSLISGLGATHISFGAETADPYLLNQTADMLDNPPADMEKRLKHYLSEGTGYPAALSRAAADFLPECGNILSRPNNILAVCYLRAIKKLNVSLIPVIISRKGSYREQKIIPESPSASALRRSLIRGDYAGAFSAMPPFSASLVRNAFLSGRIPDMSVWDSLLSDCLRTADLSVLPDISEGLDDALKKVARYPLSSREILSSLSSRRYSSARISRLCAMAMLGATDACVAALNFPSETLLLGLRKKRALTDRWKDLPVRIFTSGDEWLSAANPADQRCWRLWASCCRLPDTLPYTERLYTE